MSRSLALSLLLAVPAFGSALAAVQTVSLDSKSPLVDVKVMVRTGSSQDPEGLEGLSALTGLLMIEGSFGDAKSPVTKEKLAELTRPWGTAAMPRVEIGKEVTVFSFTVPKEALGEYTDKVIGPLLTKPLFDGKELERIRNELLQQLRSNLRLESIEELGLHALDNFIHEGTAYAHPDGGTEKGLTAVQRDHVARFYKTYYGPANLVAGLTSSDKEVAAKVSAALEAAGRAEGQTFTRRESRAPAAVSGRKAVIVSLPNAISSGIHAGFPLSVTRKDRDYWPLYVANVWFGTHRDGFSHLYQVIREERGYNYGDYSYIEHFEGRPQSLFPPFGYPRRHPYFSIWIRPVSHAFVPHLMKAVVWELESFVRGGLTEEQCSLSKNKAKVLYLNLAETTSRMLGSRLDDQFYGLEPGWLPSYLKSIDAVTCAEVNDALRRHLQTKDLKFVVTTHKDEAPKIAAALESGNEPAWAKGPADYQIDVKEEGGQKLYLVPEKKLDLLRRDAAWAYTPLRIPRSDVRIVPAERMFETAELPRAAAR